MMRCIGLLLVSSLAIASGIKTLWPTGVQYSIDYSTTILTGIPEISDTFGGYVFKATFKAENVKNGEATEVNMMFVEPKFYSFAGEVDPTKDVDIGEEIEIPAHFLSQLTSHFKVTYENDVLKAFSTVSDELEIVTNIKKGAVFESRDYDIMYGLITGKKGPNFSNKKSQEQSTTGFCDVEYNVNKIPDSMIPEMEEIYGSDLGKCQGEGLMEVIKTKDLFTCRGRAVFNYNYGANSIKSEDMFSGAASETVVSKLLFCFENDLIIPVTGVDEQKILIKGPVEDGKETNIEVIARSKWEHGKMIHKTDSLFSNTIFEKSNELPMYLELPMLSQKSNIAKDQLKLDMLDNFLVLVRNVEKSSEMSTDFREVFKDLLHTVNLYTIEDLSDLKYLLDQKLSNEHTHFRETALATFYDLLAMMPTTPMLPFFINLVESSVISPDQAAVLMGHVISRVPNPNQDVLVSLVNFIQNPIVLKNDELKYSALMALTNLVYRACVATTSSVSDYPVNFYGEICHENLDILQNDLITFLKKNIVESIAADNKKATTTYINALGNLGMKTSAAILLEIIGGKIQANTHARNLAIIKLSKAVYINPSMYNEQIMMIIKNEAEEPQVRMAAISMFPFIKTTNADWEDLAKRTWTDTSHQVCSYIATLLESLQKLPTYLQPTKASNAFKMAKPRDTGIQTSHDIYIINFLSGLNQMLVTNAKYFTAQSSAFPKMMTLETALNQGNEEIPQIDMQVNLEGAETLIGELLNIYKNMNQEGTTPEKSNKTPFETMISLNTMGIDKLITIDSTVLKNVGDLLVDELQTIKHKDENHVKHGIRKHFVKIMSTRIHYFKVATISGLPFSYLAMDPMLVSNHAKLTVKNIKKNEIDTLLKPSVSFSRYHLAMVMNPIDGTVVYSGQKAEVDAAFSVKAELSLTNAQMSMRVGTPTDHESQKEKPLLKVKTTPFVAREKSWHKLAIINNGDNLLKPRNTASKKIVANIGKPFGMDLKMNALSHKETANYFTSLECLKECILRVLTGKEQNTWEPHEFSLVYNPQQSVTKEGVLILSLGYGSKLKSMETAKMQYPVYQQDHSIELKCESSPNPALCEKELFCKKQQEKCQKKLLSQQRPTVDVHKYCMNSFNMCNQRHVSRENVRDVLSSFAEGSAVNLNVAAYLKNKKGGVVEKVKTQITIGEQNLFVPTQNTEFKIKALVELPLKPTPHIVHMDSIIKINHPTVRWDQQTMIKEDLSTTIEVAGTHSTMDESMDAPFSVNIAAFQSMELKEYVHNSDSAVKCKTDVESGFKLTNDCEMMRHSAASLDTLTMKAVLPSHFTHNIYVTTIFGYLMTAFEDYMKQTPKLHSTSETRGTIEVDIIEAEMHVDPKGKLLDGNWKTTETTSTLTKLPIQQMEGLLPICTKDSQFSRLLQKITKHGAPSRCAIENNKVKTFDGVDYDYNMEECEHIIVKECTSQPRVMVTVQKGKTFQVVKAMVGNDVYKMKVSKQAKSQRSSSVELIYNGGTKLSVSANDITQDTIWDLSKGTHMKMYADGVAELSSSDYGLTVYADSESVEVMTYQHLLRDQTCGLCGDLNDEKTADVKTEGQCIMSNPALAAYSFMLNDSSCQGIPSNLERQFKNEITTCKKKIITPTQF